MDSVSPSAEIERAERLDADDLTVVHARFLWLVARKRYGELAHISSAYLAAPEQDSAVLLRAASVLLSLDTPELRKEAVRPFERAAALSPASADARLSLASALSRTGNTERAGKAYRELLEQYPSDIRILNDLAWILQEHSQRYEEALALADKGVRRSSG